MSRYVTAAVQMELQKRSLDEIEALRSERDALAAQVSFYEARAEGNGADHLRELQHAYNLVAILVERAGGEVSVEQDALYGKRDIELILEQPEEGPESGKVVARTRPMP